MPRKKWASCHSCGKELEYADCFGGGSPTEEARCHVINGWLTIVQWRGKGAIDHYDFCSLTCLQKWLNAQIPQVPKPFLEAFGDN